MASVQSWIEQTQILNAEVSRIEREIAEIREGVVENPEKFGVKIIVWDDGCSRNFSNTRRICAVKVDAPECPHSVGEDIGPYCGCKHVAYTHTERGHGEYEEVDDFMDTWCVSVWTE